MSEQKCCLEACPAQAPLMELLRLAQEQSRIWKQLASSQKKGQGSKAGQSDSRSQRVQGSQIDLADGTQAQEIFKAIGECQALLALDESDAAVEIEREAHEEKIKKYL